MSKLTDHQLTAAIKASQATAAKHRAIGLDGNLIPPSGRKTKPRGTSPN